MIEVLLTPSKINFMERRVGHDLDPEALIEELNRYSMHCLADPESQGYDDQSRAFRIYLTSPTLIGTDFLEANAGAMIIARKNPQESYVTKKYYPGLYRPARDNSVLLEIEWALS